MVEPVFPIAFLDRRLDTLVGEVEVVMRFQHRERQLMAAAMEDQIPAQMVVGAAVAVQMQIMQQAATAATA